MIHEIDPEIDPEILDHYLSAFFVGIRKKDGSEY